MDVQRFSGHHGSAKDMGERETKDIAPKDTEDTPFLLIEAGMTTLPAISTRSCFYGSHGS